VLKCTANFGDGCKAGSQEIIFSGEASGVGFKDDHVAGNRAWCEENTWY